MSKNISKIINYNSNLNDSNLQKINDLYSNPINNIPYLPEVKNIVPKFSYEYISMNGTERCFNNLQIDTNIFIKYFEVLKELSTKSIDSWINNKKYKSNKHINKQNKDLLKLLIDNLGLKEDHFINPANIPFLCQMELNYSSGNKCPRILYIIGEKGIIYFLFFDLNHSIFKSKFKSN